jgi:hypothetical protein
MSGGAVANGACPEIVQEAVRQLRYRAGDVRNWGDVRQVHLESGGVSDGMTLADELEMIAEALETALRIGPAPGEDLGDSGVGDPGSTGDGPQC